MTDALEWDLLHVLSICISHIDIFYFSLFITNFINCIYVLYCKLYKFFLKRVEMYVNKK